MIYLAVKIFIYLLAALGLGGIGGWLLRNLTAMGREEALSRELQAAQRSLPELEAQVRGREEKNRALLAQMGERDAREAELRDALAVRDARLAEKDQSLRVLQSRLSASQDEGAGSRAGTGQQAEPASADGAPAVGVHEESAAFRARIEKLEQELARAGRALSNERRRVDELKRERELQNRTLQALNQQLEMTREARRATGS